MIDLKHRPEWAKKIFPKRKNQFQGILNQAKKIPGLENKMKNFIKTSNLSDSNLRKELRNMLPNMIEFSENNSSIVSSPVFPIENNNFVKRNFNNSSSNSSFVNSSRSPLGSSRNLYPEPNALSELNRYKQVLNTKGKELERLLKFQKTLNKNMEELKSNKTKLQNTYNKFILEHQGNKGYMNINLFENTASFKQGKNIINNKIKTKQNEINTIKKNVEKIYNNTKNLREKINQLENQRKYLLELNKKFKKNNNKAQNS